MKREPNLYRRNKYEMKKKSAQIERMKHKWSCGEKKTEKKRKKNVESQESNVSISLATRLPASHA